AYHASMPGRNNSKHSPDVAKRNPGFKENRHRVVSWIALRFIQLHRFIRGYAGYVYYLDSRVRGNDEHSYLGHSNSGHTSTCSTCSPDETKRNPGFVCD